LANFGQLRYEQNKRNKKAKRISKIMAIVKELKLSLNISEHDFQVRVSQCKKFLTKGYKVKIILQFRGREVTHPQLGIDRLNRLSDAIAEFGHVEVPPKAAGLLIHMMVAPNKGGSHKPAPAAVAEKL
jgi:translation initiation factor IF-3